MALQFVLGTAAMDHQQELLNLIKQSTDSAVQHSFYLIPNHVKFESEVQVMKRYGDNQAPIVATSQLQILSFTRLAWYYLRNQPAYQKQRISSTGISMALYQIIKDHQDELRLFDQEVSQLGFTDQLARQISEMQAGNVLPADLNRLLAGETLTNDLQDKLHDFNIVYQAYLAEVQDQYFDNQNILNLLTDYLTTIDLSDTDFYLDQFSRFTATELRLVETLVQRAHKVVISLTLDKPYPVELPDATNLFYQSAKTFWRLYHFAADNQVPYLSPIKATTSRVSSALQSLENYWVASTNLKTDLPRSSDVGDTIQVWQADNRYSELLQVATWIRQQVAMGNYRYTDFVILTRHLDQYQQIIAPVMQSQAIPYFEDQQKTMADHPLVELIAALFAIETPTKNKRHYRYADMMRLLKSELFIPIVEGQPMPLKQYRQAVSLTENVILKTGYEDFRWTQAADWQYNDINRIEDDRVVSDKDAAATDLVNQIRRYVKQTLPPFYKKLFKAKTNQDAAVVLYEFLQNSGVFNQLEQWRQNDVDQGDITGANQIEQVVNNLNSLLDEEVLILGQQPFNFEEFWNILLTGFQNAQYSAIPSTLDQVRISESGIVQPNNRKVTIMIGATDDNMPAQQVNEGLFGDDDLVQLQTGLTENQYLSDSSDIQMAGEPYLNYLAFLSSSQQLIFTFCPSTGDESDVAISPYVSRIKNFFNLKIQHHAAIPQNDNHIRPYLGTKRGTLHHLIQVIQASFSNQQELSPAWRMVYNKLVNDPSSQTLTEQLLQSINYQNVPTKLTDNIVTGLYGQTINSSISQLELFYRNPYEYFLQYGLRLQEREIFTLSSASTGQFFHEALDLVIRTINDQGWQLADVSDETLTSLVTEISQRIVNDPQQQQYLILTSSSRMNYLTQQLTQTVLEMAKTLRNQSRLTAMRPKKTELIFGQPVQTALKGLSFAVADDRQVNVRGRIDRIDMIQADTRHYYGIVDYKSGAKTFDYGKAYDGTELQLLTYLDVLRQNLVELDEEEALIAGALYLQVHNPRFKTKDLQANDYNFEKLALKDHQYNGLIVDDATLVDEMVKDVAESTNSLIYPLKKKKEGVTSTKRANDPLITAPDLTLFLAHNEQLIKTAAQRIFNGDIALAPVRYSDNTSAMQYTPYKAIMNFDPLLAKNNYRMAPKLSDKDVLRLLREEK